jgi:2-C-methyl-D-erythritol 4-phosphate cytidylyltransferase / 2-C-methyl-D-erythritol 2,4-cyclodiphosphate synthase
LSGKKLEVKVPFIPQNVKTSFAKTSLFWHYLTMNHAIILAAGQSQRLNSTKDKLLIEVAERPIIYYALSAINDHHLINDIVLVVNKQNKSDIEKVLKTYKFSKVKKIVIGGVTRQKSLENGLKAVEKLRPGNSDLIVVHNGASPLPSYDEITKAIQKAEETNACIVAHKVNDTIKQAKGKRVHSTLDRKDLYAAQTPQVIQFTLLKNAIKNANKKGIDATDEAMLLESLGKKVDIVEAHENNFKITTKADIDQLKVVLGDGTNEFRAGIGQDSHMFSKTKKGLTLGGVLLKDEPKLEANSDGDVILHAIFNALSQAIGDQSLGFYADPLCEKGIKDSQKYLEIVLKKVGKLGLDIGNVGVMIECKTPKIDPIAKKIKASLSKILKIDIKKIGITSTSGENLTVFGSGLGIQCFTIVSLVAKKTPAKKPAKRKQAPKRKPAKKKK